VLFLRPTKNHLANPSENCALDFNHEFRPYAICSVSATIDIDRPKASGQLATTEVQHGDGVSRAVAGGDCRAAKDLVWV
jgi:hypothetical protein